MTISDGAAQGNGVANSEYRFSNKKKKHTADIPERSVYGERENIELTMVTRPCEE